MLSRGKILLGFVCAVSVLMEASSLPAQQPGWVSSVSLSLPEAPAAQQTAEPQQGAPAAAPPPSAQPPSQKGQAERELEEEERQRILKVVPDFESTDNMNAAPLSVRQKFRLALHSELDPFPVVTALLDAGLSQANNDFPGYGQGVKGYAKRTGAAYADGFDAILFNNAVFPALLREDPRYFRMGTGKFQRRLLHAVASTVWTRNDNKSWGLNYANVAGNIVAGGISNLYYPAANRGVGLTFQRAFTLTVEGGLGAIGTEFWPDISRKFLHGFGLKNGEAAPAGPASSP